MITMVNIFGERLKKLRAKEKYSQEMIASLLGVNRMTVVKWEKGTSEPSINQVRYLAYLFDVEISYLLGEDNFTLYLMVTAEDYLKVQKQLINRKSEQLELAQWIVYWNNIIEQCAGSWGGYKQSKEYEDINSQIGKTNESDDVILEYPQDYNNLIIDYIIKSDYNGLLETYWRLPTNIEEDLPFGYKEKPDLYKHMLGFEKQD